MAKEKKRAIFQMGEGYWYRIPGFNGYEITMAHVFPYYDVYDDGYDPIRDTDVEYVVRSFKNFNKYPNGYIIRRRGAFPNYSWEMTDNNNRRQIVTLQSIIQRLIDCTYINAPRTFNMIDIASRNRIMENAGVNNHPLPPGFNTELRPARFTILKTPENLNY